MPTVFRLDVVSPGGFDRQLALLGGGKLVRAAHLYLEIDAPGAVVARELGLAGVRTQPCDALPEVGDRLRPAIALDLAPLDDTVAAMDIVELHRIELGEATRTLMHRRLRLLPPNRGTRDVCRRLLRGEDAVLGWRRVVWCSLGALRAARGRARLRPVVFDRTAVERAPLRWTYVGVGAVERWAFR